MNASRICLFNLEGSEQNTILNSQTLIEMRGCPDCPESFLDAEHTFEKCFSLDKESS